MAQTLKSSKREMTPEEIAGKVKNVAKNVKDAAISVRMVVKALRETGAMNEVAEAIREAAITSRYTAKQVSETAKELESKGIIKEIASAAAETKESAKTTLRVVKGVIPAATAATA